MTTLELIENHGIGHNCLSDAYDLGYQQGRAEPKEKDEVVLEFEQIYKEGLLDPTDKSKIKLIELCVSVMAKWKGGAENAK